MKALKKTQTQMSAAKTARDAKSSHPKSEAEWMLRLYVAGKTPRCMAAISNLERLCEEHLKGRYIIQIVDLLENPKLAAGDQIIAIPTLVRKLPEPMRKIIGDLSNSERVLVGLDVKTLH